MSERPPEKQAQKSAEIIDFSERLKRRQNQGANDTLRVNAEGDLVYPEKKIELSHKEALEVAQSICEEFKDIKTLTKAQLEWKLFVAQDPFLRTDVSSYRDITASESEVAEEVARERVYQKESSTQTLISLLGMHAEHPMHFSRPRIYAIALMLRERLMPGTRGD